MEKNKKIMKFKVDSSWDNREKALIFSYRIEFIKKFTTVVEENFNFFVKYERNLDSLITELHFSKYQLLDGGEIIYLLEGKKYIC